MNFVSIVCALSGFLIIFFASYLDMLYKGKDFLGLGIIGDIIIEMTKSIGVALITSTFVNGLKYYFETSENLVKEGFFDRLSMDEVREIKDKMEDKLYFEKNEHDKDNFYSFFGQELSTLLDKSYYKKYEARVICQIKDDYIKKTIYKRLEIVNPSRRPVTEKIPFEAYMKKVDRIDNINELYRIVSFKVNSEDKTGQIRDCLKIEDISAKCSDGYCIKVAAEYEFKIVKSASIYMIIETLAPKTDVFFTNYVTKPCKDYNIIFVIDKDSYEVDGYIFGLVDGSKNRLVEGKLGNGMELGFRDWILPGDGVVFAINKIK